MNLTFEIYLATLEMESLVCYEFYELDLAHCFQGIEETAKEFQRTHSLLPNSPFCGYNTHQSIGTQEVCTIWWICTL